jgi:hypothetical protein
MKNLILLLLITTILSCNTGIHSFYPLIVEEVSSNFDKCAEKQTKYRLTIKGAHSDDEIHIFTDSLFQVGDTIK